jgi:hypothetical protein
MSDLRTEIIESEKARSDLLKWKLIGVATLGAAGLGLNNPQQGVRTYFLPPLIPLLCFYADQLCRHLTLRILVIAAFLRSHATDDQKIYEDFVLKIGRTRVAPCARGPLRHFFKFEDIALDWSTIFLSALVLVVGIAPALLPVSSPPQSNSTFEVFAVASGVVSIA